MRAQRFSPCPSPGFTWPEAYYAVWVPEYERNVITASVDDYHGWGYCDVALGHFGANKDLVRSSLERIEQYWQDQRDGHEQEAWESITQTGLVTAEAAELSRQRVWPDLVVDCRP